MKIIPKEKYQLQTTKLEFYIDARDLERIWHLVDSCKTYECQWFLQLERYYHPEKAIVRYYAHTLTIPEQTVSGATVDSDPMLMYKLSQEVKDRYTIDEKLDLDAFNTHLAKMSCWCHSHVAMNPSPSSVDNGQFSDLVRAARDNTAKTTPVVAMIIFNQRREIFTRLMDLELSLFVENLPLEVYLEDIDLDYINDAVQNKIKHKPITAYGGHSLPAAYSGQGYPRARTGGYTAAKLGVSLDTLTPEALKQKPRPKEAPPKPKPKTKTKSKSKSRRNKQQHITTPITSVKPLVYVLDKVDTILTLAKAIQSENSETSANGINAFMSLAIEYLDLDELPLVGILITGCDRTQRTAIKYQTYQIDKDETPQEAFLNEIAGCSMVIPPEVFAYALEATIMLSTTQNQIEREEILEALETDITDAWTAGYAFDSPIESDA
jgi:hypothetical protein